jgi:hypothetical protein
MPPVSPFTQKGFTVKGLKPWASPTLTALERAGGTFTARAAQKSSYF